METLFVIEVCDRAICKVVRCAGIEDAIATANRLLVSHIKDINLIDEYDADASEGEGWAKAAPGSHNAWCNWCDMAWDAFIVSNTESVGALAPAAEEPTKVDLQPCPVCNTADYVYVVPSKTDHTRFQCICNVCGLGESLPNSANEEEAIRVWNSNRNSLTQESLQIARQYEQFKLQWMIDHGYNLKDLIAELQAMVDEDLDGTDVPTTLKSLFEDWEFGIGFTRGSIWPCFEEWMQNEREAGV